MKKIGFLLLGLFLLFVFMMFIAGCKKDSKVTPQPPPPVVDTVTLTAFANAQMITNSTSYAIEILKGDTLHLSWNYTGEIPFEIKLNGEHFSSDVFGRIDVQVNSDLLFTFLIKGTEQKAKIAITAKASPKPIISVNAVPFHVQFHGVSVITVSSAYGDSITSDQPGVHGPGSFPTPALDKTVTYHYKIWGKGGTAVDSAKITVDPAPIQNLLFITAHPWRIKGSLRKCNESDAWDTLTPSQEYMDEVNYFYTDLTAKTYLYGVWIDGPWPFVITADSLHWGNGPYKIIILNDTVMVIKHQIPSSVCSSGFVITQDTYIPAQSVKKK